MAIVENKPVETTILLCGGKINYIDLPVGTNVSNSMVPVNGKPVIAWIIEDLISKKITNITIVLRKENNRLFSFLDRVYSDRTTLKFVFLHLEGNIINSLHAGLSENDNDGIVRVILGDTLIRDSFTENFNFVYTAPVTDSRRWCLVSFDNNKRITQYFDKQSGLEPPYNAIAGYYHFLNGKLLNNCVTDSIKQKEKELSDVLTRYGRNEPIYAKTVSDWYDFGNIDRLIEAKQKLLKPRYFNSLSINQTLGTITKFSKNNQKLKDELDWYQNIPEPLKVLTPRILHYEPQNNEVQIVQEYYGYPTLAELYVYGEFHSDTWISILNRVMAIHKEFLKYSGSLNEEYIQEMYSKKIFLRLKEAGKQDNSWREILSAQELMFNNKNLIGIPGLRNFINQISEKLAKTTSTTVIHGDFCFSNILFDINNQIIRLIDPRGRFGKKGIYGDPRYDIAKLRHSVHEYYDYIVADMFDCYEKNGEFYGGIYKNGSNSEIIRRFDEMILSLGYNLDEIKFIEGLLFISMLPLHHDNNKRQKMMFFTGLKLLNGVYYALSD